MAQSKKNKEPELTPEQLKEKEIFDHWPYLYRPNDWDSQELKEAHQILMDDQEDFEGLEFEDLTTCEITKFFYAKHDAAAYSATSPPSGTANIEISYSSKSIKLPDFVAEVAPRRTVIQDNDDPRGNKINPIPGSDIRYASIAPKQLESDIIVVMLSLWIKPPEGYKSQQQIIEEEINARTIKRNEEEELNDHYVIETLTRNEDWQISNLYFGMKTPKEALMFCNAVSRLVYECNDNNKWRVRMIRIQGSGFLLVAPCTLDDRDQIDKERKEADPSDDEDDDDDDDDYYYDDDSDEDKTEEPEEEGPPQMTPKEASLPAEKLFMIVDEEQIGLYKTAYSEQPFYDLRLYENPTNVSIDTINIDRKTYHLEVQKDESVFMMREAEGEEESFEKIRKLTLDGYVMAKPKNIFVDVKVYDEYHDELRIDTPEKLRAYQRHVLETLDARNLTFAESMARAKPRYMPRFPPDIEGLPPQPPYPPLYMREWLKLLITGEHLDKPLHPKLLFYWHRLLAPTFANLIASRFVNPAIPGDLEKDYGEDELRDILDDIRDDLMDMECKQALSRWYTTKKLYGQDLLFSIMAVPDIEMLRRIYHLPGPVFL